MSTACQKNPNFICNLNWNIADNAYTIMIVRFQLNLLWWKILNIKFGISAIERINRMQNKTVKIETRAIYKLC